MSTSLLYHALGIATTDGQITSLPMSEDLPPVRLAARLPAYGFGHGSPPFGHAAIIAWPARRGSPDAHECRAEGA